MDANYDKPNLCIEILIFFVRLFFFGKASIENNCKKLLTFPIKPSSPAKTLCVSSVRVNYCITSHSKTLLERKQQNSLQTKT